MIDSHPSTSLLESLIPALIFSSKRLSAQDFATPRARSGEYCPVSPGGAFHVTRDAMPNQ